MDMMAEYRNVGEDTMDEKDTVDSSKSSQGTVNVQQPPQPSTEVLDYTQSSTRPVTAVGRLAAPVPRPVSPIQRASAPGRLIVTLRRPKRDVESREVV